MTDFYEGQTFLRTYPTEAVHWCNKHPGCLIKEIASEGESRRFQIQGPSFLTEEELNRRELANAKLARTREVSNLVVEVDGLSFDGNEKAQDRMLRAVSTAELLGTKTVDWVLADNSVASITVTQLKEALKKSVEQTTRLWIKPYTTLKEVSGFCKPLT